MYQHKLISNLLQIFNGSRKTSLWVSLPLIFFVFLFPQIANGQECGTDELHQLEMETNPEYRNAVLQADAAWKWYLNNKEQHRRLEPSGQNKDTVFEIPVVVHIYYTNAANNPSDQTIEEWIHFMNQVFEASYPGYPNEGEGGTRIPIKLVLAKRSPDCRSTNGIVRIDMSGNQTYVTYGVRYSGQQGLSKSELCEISQWPPNLYYNIHIVNKIQGSVQGAGIAGFANFGTTYPVAKTDGHVIKYTYAKSGQHTGPHEIAHSFYILHTFQGGNNLDCPPAETDCELQGDRVCDTDPSKSLLSSCPSPSTINPCTNTPFGEGGVQKNFMSYSSCRNRFTPGQKERMLYYLNYARPDLINSKAGTPLSPVSISQVLQYTPVPACIPGHLHEGINMNIGPYNVFFNNLEYYSIGYSPSASNQDSSYYVDNTGYNCLKPTPTTELLAGNSYPLSVTLKKNTNQVVAVYIDYDNNGTFSTDERVLYKGTTTVDDYLIESNDVPELTYQSEQVDSLIEIPINVAYDKPLRMRVIVDKFEFLDKGQVICDTFIVEGDTIVKCRIEDHVYVFPPDFEITPCGALDFGQAEDFVITIKRRHPGINQEFITALHELNGIAFYPNPVVNELNIRSEESLTEIRMMASDGRTVAYLSGSELEDNAVHSLSLSFLPSGMYFVRVVKSSGEVVSQKIVRK